MNKQMEMDPLRKASLLTLQGLEIPVSNIEDQDEWAYPNLIWMRQHCINEIETLPIDKINRWIGFIQGSLAVQGQLDVSKERDRTRPFFHEAYKQLNQKIPETKSR